MIDSSSPYFKETREPIYHKYQEKLQVWKLSDNGIICISSPVLDKLPTGDIAFA